MLFLVFALLPITHSANIFAGALLDRSHLTALYDVVLILADAGHNITFVNIVSGGLEKVAPHPQIHGVDVIVWDDEDKDMMWEVCVKHLIKGESGDAIKAFTADCIEVWGEIWRRSAGVYTGEPVMDLFSRTQFDVIIGEKVRYTGIALLGAITNVPVVNFEPSFLLQGSLIHNNLPMLLTSQPSMLYSRDLHRSPSFTERLSGMSSAFKMLPFIQTADRIMQPFLEKFEFSGQQVIESVKLFLTNDHPAFTFPFLRPPNDIPIGCATLLGSKSAPLEFSPQISWFLNNSVEKDVVYVSLGSYVKMRDVSWYSQLVEILTELNLRVIVKVDNNFEEEFPNSVLPLNWAPQKDLLRSGRMKLFISHCGNNGRIETIYYNVPVLCIPQYGDQPVNAELIKVNGFGEILMKEEISVQGKELIAAMIANHGTYQRNMKKASDIVENEPGNVRENLVFYVEQVAEFGNVDYLVNKVIKQQSMVEIYNLDIIVPVVMIAIVVVGFILYGLLKFCFYFSRKVGMFGFMKLKNE